MISFFLLIGVVQFVNVGVIQTLHHKNKNLKNEILDLEKSNQELFEANYKLTQKAQATNNIKY